MGGFEVNERVISGAKWAKIGVKMTVFEKKQIFKGLKVLIE